MLCFWVLSMSHAKGYSVNSVFTDIRTLMDYWGSALLDHLDVQCAEIKQEFISSDRLTADIETLVQVEIFTAEKGVYERLYFLDAKDVVTWQTHQEQYVPAVYDFGNMMLRTMHINRDGPHKEIGKPFTDLFAPATNPVRRIRRG